MLVIPAKAGTPGVRIEQCAQRAPSRLLKPDASGSRLRGNDALDSDGHGGQQYAPLMEIEIP